jgi:hypothetical protein
MKQNISSLDEFLSFLESNTSKIARELRKEGYGISGHMEIKVPQKKQPPYDMVGILRKKEPIKKKILGVSYNLAQREDCIGKIWTDNRKINGIEANDKRWIVEIYGPENFMEMDGLSNRLSSLYGVETPKFVYIDPREETYLSDLHR